VAGDAAEEHKLTIGPRATKGAKITQLKDDIAYALRWRSPAGFGLLVGLGGLFIGGPVGGAVGFLAGYQVVVRGVRPIFLAAALALLATAAFTLIEAPLEDVHIRSFPSDHPLAEVTAKVGALLVLAGLTWLFVRRDRTKTSGDTWPVRNPAVAPLLVAILIAGLVLWRIGDQRWQSAGLVLAIMMIVLLVVLMFAQRRSFPRGR
jgi:hypothetical protein